VLDSGAFGACNKGLHSFVRELAVSGAPRLQAKLGLEARSQKVLIYVGDAVLACEAPTLLIESDSSD
jgi:hypothetical protein